MSVGQLRIDAAVLIRDAAEPASAARRTAAAADSIAAKLRRAKNKATAHREAAARESRIADFLEAEARDLETPAAAAKADAAAAAEKATDAIARRRSASLDYLGAINGYLPDVLAGRAGDRGALLAVLVDQASSSGAGDHLGSGTGPAGLSAETVRRNQAREALAEALADAASAAEAAA